MNICFLNSLYYQAPLGGGVSYYLHQIPRALAEMGHSVTIVTSGRNQHKIEHKVHVISVQKLEVYASPLLLLSSFYILRRISYMIKVTRYIIKNDFDIVEVADGGFEHLFLVFLTRKPIVTRMHGRMYLRKKLPLISFFTFLENIPIKKSNGVIFPSASYQTYAKRIYGDIFQKSTTIPYAIEVPKRIKVRNIQNKKIILIVGMVSIRKGIDLLIKIANNLIDDKNIIFILIGSNLNDIPITCFPKNILYRGYQDHQALHSYYNQSEIVLSTSRFETFGISIAEAMSYGKPVIVNDSVGVKDFVQHGVNGYIFKKDNADDATLKIRKLLDNKTLRTSFGNNALHTMKTYSLKKVLTKTISYYEQIIKTSA